MAHVGKHYKLAFRRDLALNHLNVDAYPEGAFLQTFFLGGTVGDRIQQNDILVRNLLVDGQPPMVWTSDIIVTAGIPFRCTVTLDGFNGLDPPFGKLLVKRTDTGTILFETGSNNGRQNGGPSGCSWNFTAVGIETPACHRLGALVAFGIAAANWSEYNP